MGETLTHIQLSRHQLDFHFENVRITCEYMVEYVAADGASMRHDIQALLGATIGFHRCIDREVVALDVEELRLSLRFDDGSVLRIESELGPYESGQIGSQRVGLIVF